MITTLSSFLKKRNIRFNASVQNNPEKLVVVPECQIILDWWRYYVGWWR